MEFESSFVFFALFLISLLWVAKRNLQSPSSIPKLPPGPWKLPFIGNLHQLAMGGSDTHHVMRKLAHKYGPLMHLQLGEMATVVVSSREMAKEFLKTYELNFAERPSLLPPRAMGYGLADISFSRYGDYWKQIRKICNHELLSPKMVQSLSFIREDETRKVIELAHESAGSLLNLTDLLYPLVSSIICRAVFGRTTERQEMATLLKQVIEIAGFDVCDLFPSYKLLHLITRKEAKFDKLHQWEDKILEKILNDHKQKKKMKSKQGGTPESESEKENLVDVLLRLQQSGDLAIPITDNNIKAIIMEMFAAGTDTTASTTEWAMAEMMKNPTVREKAQAEIRGAFKGKKTICEKDMEAEELSYLKSVIKETLRLHPPVPLLIPRQCREACRIGGYDIPKNTVVFVNLWGLGRDPEYWHNAESFIPERFHENNSVDFKGANFEFIPFGSGRRMCAGMSFALADIQFTLACLLYHFDWQLPDNMKPEEVDMTERFQGNINRKSSLCLIPIPYNP